jgi:hypothetical protein
VNNWTHVAASSTGTSFRLFLNGVQQGATGTSSSNALSGSSTVSIGFRVANTDGLYAGYISNLRVVKGLAVYTGNFVPPAGPLNNSQVENQSGAPSAAVTVSQTSLLLNTAFGANFLVDGSINNLTVTNVGTATSATLDPFVFTPKT